MHEIMITLSILRNLSPFDYLSDDQLGRIVSKVSTQAYPKGEQILARGKPSVDSVYLLKGIVELEAADGSTAAISHASQRAKKALNITQPNRISVTAKTDVTMMLVNRDFMDLVMVWRESARSELPTSADSIVVNEEPEDWMGILLSSPLFARIPSNNIQTLFQRFESMPVKVGQEIIAVDEEGDLFYVIKHGQAEVVDRNGVCQAELTIGDYFGEEALVGDTTRNASVTMRCNGELMCLTKDTFNELLHQPLVDFVSIEEYFKLLQNPSQFSLIDVRLKDEFDLDKLTDTVNIPLASIRNSLDSMDRALLYLVSDSGGRRSEIAVQLMCQAGLNVKMLRSSDIISVEL